MRQPRRMSDFTKVTLRDVEDAAPKFGMPSQMQARFARNALGADTFGLSLMRLAPGFRQPFGHAHAGQEEVYVVLSGAARVNVAGEIVDLAEGEALRVGRDTMRAVEAGPDGVEYLAFGAGDDPSDATMVDGWWG